MEPLDTLLSVREGTSFSLADQNDSGKVTFVLATPDGRHFKVSGMVKTILETFDGRSTIAEVALKCQSQGIPITELQLNDLVQGQLHRMGVFEGVSSEVQQSTSLLFANWELASSDRVLSLSQKLVGLYSKFGVVVSLTLILISRIMLYFGDPIAKKESVTPGAYLTIFGLVIVSMLIHELGHSTALTRKQMKPGGIGFGLFIMMPTFYADVSAAWRLQTADRLIVDFGGIYFQLLFSVLLHLLGVVFGYPDLIYTCHAIDLIVAMNMNPFFRFDGYWCLVDYLGIPKLQSLAINYIKSLGRALFGKKTELTIPPMSLLKLSLFKGYSIISVALIFIMFQITVNYLQRVIVDYPKTIPGTYLGLVAQIHEQDPIGIIASSFMLFFLVAIPVSAVVGLGLFSYRASSKMCQWIQTKIPRQGVA